MVDLSFLLLIVFDCYGRKNDTHFF